MHNVRQIMINGSLLLLEIILPSLLQLQQFDQCKIPPKWFLLCVHPMYYLLSSGTLAGSAIVGSKQPYPKQNQFPLSTLPLTSPPTVKAIAASTGRSKISSNHRKDMMVPNKLTLVEKRNPRAPNKIVIRSASHFCFCETKWEEKNTVMLILILAVCVFCRRLSVLYVDNIQYALKTSIVSIRGTSGLTSLTKNEIFG